MKHILEALDAFFQKTASKLNVLQLHFYETHLIIGRPLMSEAVSGTMMRTHRCALGRYSPNPSLRAAAENAPLVGCVLTPRFYPLSRVLKNPPSACPNERQTVPWGVKIILPEENLKKLEEAKKEALLYCASEIEMSEWIDWFEPEDKAASLTNQLLAVEREFQEQAVLKRNIWRRAMPFYLKSVAEYYKLPKGSQVSSTLLKADFAPLDDSDMGAAYQRVSESISFRRKRHFEDFQRFWRTELIKLLFEGLPWEEGRRYAFLEYLHNPKIAAKPGARPRWDTSSAIDRQTYGSFIRYFLDRFIGDSIKHQAEGEIVLLLWFMIYAARDLEKPAPIKSLLKLTWANVNDRLVRVEGGEIEISCGLAELIKEYAGEGTLCRQRKLFPNLTIDRLEDHFRRASGAILPPGSLAALPEAFLTFPHPEKNLRMNAKDLRQSQKIPPKVYYDPVSLKELKRQLVEKSKPRPS